MVQSLCVLGGDWWEKKWQRQKTFKSTWVWRSPRHPHFSFYSSNNRSSRPLFMSGMDVLIQGKYNTHFTFIHFFIRGNIVDLNYWCTCYICTVWTILRVQRVTFSHHHRRRRVGEWRGGWGRVFESALWSLLELLFWSKDGEVLWTGLTQSSRESILINQKSLIADEKLQDFFLGLAYWSVMKAPFAHKKNFLTALFWDTNKSFVFP